MFLWLRMGDNADYEKIDSIEEAKEIFEERELIKNFTFCYQYGIKNDEFAGHNYISLFYGNKDADPIRAITSKELIYLNE